MTDITKDLAILISQKSFDKSLLKKYYVKNIKKIVGKIDIFYIIIPYKMGLIEGREYLENNVYPICDKFSIKNLLVADGSMFKTLTGEPSTKNLMKPLYNISKNPKYDGKYNCLTIPNYDSFFYNPALANSLIYGLKPLKAMLNFLPYKEGIDFKTRKIVNGVEKIKKELSHLLKCPKLTVDIEAFSLQHHKAGIGTISFSFSQRDAVGFYVDYLPKQVHKKHYKSISVRKKYKKTDAVRINNTIIYELLLWFFKKYKGVCIFHNLGYDVRVLIYVLFMKNNIDRKGLIKGLKSFANSEDTQLLTILAKNSAENFTTDLKSNTIEYCGNYSVDVSDITKQDPKALLEYNHIDSAGTFYLYNKYKKIPKKQNQEYLYHLLRNGALLFVDIQLSGMPVDMKEVIKLQKTLANKKKKHLKTINNSKVIKVFNYYLKTAEYLKKLASWKVKRVPFKDIKYDKFNPNSNPQLVKLLHYFYRIPIMQFTANGNPSTDKDTLKMYMEAVNLNTFDEFQPLKKVLNEIKLLNEMGSITSTFIPAFLEYSVEKGDIYYLFGNYKFPGTVSLRPTSSNPNMLNLPSTGSPYAKSIKKCVKPPKGRVMLSADFDSQEHKANALITKDPNMLAEYASGLDGHGYRAIHYFFKEFPKRFRDMWNYQKKHGNKGKYYVDKKGKLYTGDNLK